MLVLQNRFQWSIQLDDDQSGGPPGTSSTDAPANHPLFPNLPRSSIQSFLIMKNAPVALGCKLLSYGLSLLLGDCRRWRAHNAARGCTRGWPPESLDRGNEFNHIHMAQKAAHTYIHIRTRPIMCRAITPKPPTALNPNRCVHPSLCRPRRCASSNARRPLQLSREKWQMRSCGGAS